MQRKDTFFPSGKRVGRPRSITTDTTDILINRIASGRVLEDVCTDEDMPSGEWVYTEMNRLPKFAEAVASARRSSAHSLAASAVMIADAAGPDNIPQLVINRCNQRRWLAGKFNSMYADKPTEVTVSVSWEKLIEQVAQRRLEPPTIDNEESKTEV